MSAGLVVTLLYLAVLNGCCASRNVDTSEPVVIRSPSSDPDDGFGWTVIFHHIEPISSSDSPSDVLRKTRLLVGAPKGTFHGGLNYNDPFQPAVNNTGLVYNCPVLGLCEGVRGDIDRYINTSNVADNRVTELTFGLKFLYPQPMSEGRLFDQAPDSIVFSLSGNIQSEQKRNQLMGSFLYSNGDHVIACAQRWVTSNLASDQMQPRGICFMGDRNLENFVTQLACTGSGGSNRAVGDGFCLTGSATIAFNYIHIGAPGQALFGGTVRSRPITSTLADSWTSTEMFLNRMLTPSQRFTDTTLAYFGYTVTSGFVNNRINSSIEDILVVSPRDREQSHIGRVYLYAQAQLGQGLDTAVAKGTQMGEFFGFSIAMMDLTGNGYDDMVVGAPMYSRLEEPIRVEQGRAYVFFHNGSPHPNHVELHAYGSVVAKSEALFGARFISREQWTKIFSSGFYETPVVLENSLARSRFGYSIGDVGDLNADGYEDVVIGAPYEKMAGSDNTGAVYVYYGMPSMEEFVMQTPQKITASTVVASVSTVTTLRTFGFSVAGNADVDANQYNDIAIGSYLDRSVVVLRSLPIVTVETEILPIPNVTVDFNPSFSVTVRTSYSGVGVNRSIEVPFVLSERVTTNQVPRLVFSNEGLGVLQMTAPGVFTEQTLTVMTMDDYTATEPYELSVRLNSQRPRSSGGNGQETFTDFSRNPLVTQNGTKDFTVYINPPCRSAVCQTDLFLSVSNVTATPIAILQGRNSVTMTLFYSALGPEEGQNVELTFSNFPTGVFSSVALASIEGDGISFPCVFGETVTCRLQPRIFVNRVRAQTHSVVALIFINNSALLGDEDDFNVTVSLGVPDDRNSSDPNSANNVLAVPFSVTSSSNISSTLSFSTETISYSRVLPQQVKSPSDLGQAVRITLTVANQGPSVIVNTSVFIKFPRRMSGEYLLYPVDISPVITRTGNMAGTVATCSQSGLNPDNLRGNDATVVRRRRLSDIPVEASRNTRAKRQSISSNINCDVEQCETFSCSIGRLTADSVDIVLETVLDERYLATQTQFYDFTLESEVIVVEKFQEDRRTNKATIRIQQSESEAQDRTVLIHAIVWSIVGATILIVLAVILLYCLGFFKRKTRKDDVEPCEDAFEPVEGNNIVDLEEEKEEKL